MGFKEQMQSEELRTFLTEQAERMAMGPESAASAVERAWDLLKGTADLGIPEKKLLSKLGTSKKRTVYLFPKEDALALKALGYCLNRSDLGLLPCCHAFRPGFSIHAAYRSIVRAYRPEWCCLHVDLQDYFNRIPCERLVSVIEATFGAGTEISRLLTALVRNPLVLENGTLREEPNKGAMAGMPIAPILANLYLKHFDAWAQEQAPVYARYSDDLLFFCEPEAVGLLWDRVEARLTEEGLAMNREKTRVSGIGEAWDYLGLSCRQGAIDLSEGTVRKMKGKISRAARKLHRWKLKSGASTERAVKAMIRKFQYKFYGSGAEDEELTWSRWYFPLITDTAGLAAVDQHFQQWARYLATGRHTKQNHRLVPYGALQAWGYVPLVSVFHNRERDPSLRKRLDFVADHPVAEEGKQQVDGEDREIEP